MAGAPLSIVVLISGTGSNLQSLIDAREAGTLNVDIRRVIANRPRAPGLTRAERAGIRPVALDHRRFDTREAFDGAMVETIETARPDLVVLAGFMRILTDGFVDRFTGRMINLHPSLLPDYRGLHTYERCLADGVSEHGTSVHFVTRELDGGPVIAQAPVAVRDDDTPDSLRERVQAREHVLLPEVVRWFAAGRVVLDNGRVHFDGRPLEQPIRLTEDNVLHFPLETRAIS
jgi:phosphoribosylglycinamide formyltransferase-1